MRTENKDVMKSVQVVQATINLGLHVATTGPLPLTALMTNDTISHDTAGFYRDSISHLVRDITGG